MSSADLLILLNECRLSAEDLGKLIGVSGMTVRRWVEKPNAKLLPEIYRLAIDNAIFKMVIEGRLDSSSKSAIKAFSGPAGLSQQAAAKALGFPQDLKTNFSDDEDAIMSGLSTIGAMESRRKSVDESHEKLPFYKKMGREWSQRITLLTRIIGSKNLAALDKFPAYGALFYLLMTFDLIPDTIPVFGFMDDFTILGVAVAYYIRRQIRD
jgi:uncharacterized membrane protein YkvA (DUF1232 family)